MSLLCLDAAWDELTKIYGFFFFLTETLKFFDYRKKAHVCISHAKIERELKLIQM